MASLKENSSQRIPTVIGGEIWHFSILESGFQKAKELINAYPRGAHGRIIITDEITKAKGRFNRTWIANKGGLWLTISLYEEFLTELTGLFSLLFGVALGKAVRELQLEEIYVKWINDLHHRGRKLAGVLIEKWHEWYLVGIGLNVNNTLPPGLPAVNLKTLLGQEISPLRVLELLLPSLNHYYHELWLYEKRILEEEKDNPNKIVEDFLNFSDSLHRCVFYGYNLDEEEGVVGMACGISSRGGLIISTDEGLIEVNSGEIIYV
ncbi:MAG: biotin--[acetyl-CoA-carboxylase] ligase [Caldimicrobium sp.]|nr:biotin--[acetyl-CoA-carboxylase] ligase [Caldimicrobium sp.]MCX7612860.1 biotin--[acetyl-CoA-carboxylase] ligase [Caldimicrobium sp.]MDW8183612.1 biotin--[acetyl-CoA-carboxylase] ligase [Caldimicrobium sp.]